MGGARREEVTCGNDQSTLTDMYENHITKPVISHSEFTLVRIKERKKKGSYGEALFHDPGVCVPGGAGEGGFSSINALRLRLTRSMYLLLGPSMREAGSS